MYYNYDYHAPTSRDDMMEELVDIEQFFKSRQNELPETTLEKLTATRISQMASTDAQLTAKAKILLNDDFEKDFLERKTLLTEKKREYVRKKQSAATAKTAKIESLEKTYADNVKKAKADAVKRGVEYSTEITLKIAAINEELSLKKAAAESDYAREAAEYDSMIADCNSDIAAVKDYFADVHAAKLSKKQAELKAEEEKAAIEALKYNNGLEEKEIRLNNGVVQSQAKLVIDYLAIKVTDLTEQELAVRGYFHYVMKAITDYYYSYTNKVTAYQDFLSEATLITYLGSYYQNMLTLFYQRAYPENAP